jgi:catechol 2,3-dioxygenase-like lactoylglutathione lyase family enzyme
LVARDWRALVAFYHNVFDCEPVPPERDQHGDWLDRGTGVPGLTIRGMHLRLPGWGDDGPTLEVYSYSPALESPLPMPQRPGLGHLAFQVDDVRDSLERVLAAGGSAVGEPVDVEVAGAGRLSFVYVRDPEGNIIELQRWL